MRTLAAAVLAAAMAAPAAADEVVLRNGARFEGKVTESEGSVTVAMDFGSITFKKIDVARIERGSTPLSEFETRLAALRDDDVDGRYRLALWARQKELAGRARRLLEEVVAREPEHEGARLALGYRRHDGRWMMEDEVRRAQGYVLFRGEWVLRETADGLRRFEAERAAELARSEELHQLRQRTLEAEAAALLAREEADRARNDDYYYPRFVVWRTVSFCHRIPKSHGKKCEERGKGGKEKGISR